MNQSGRRDFLRAALGLGLLGSGALIGAGRIFGSRREGDLNRLESEASESPAPATPAGRPASNYLYLTTDFSADSGGLALARTIFGEARECAPREMVAVGFTAVNRLRDGRKRFGNTIREVVLAPAQYACYNHGDPNRQRVMDPAYEGNFAVPDEERVGERALFERCLAVAEGILAGRYSDPAQGATHYHTVGSHPYWEKSPKMKRVGRVQVGGTRKSPILSKHIFYIEK